MASIDELTAAIRAGHEREVHRIEGQHELHPAARQVLLARATIRARDQMAALAEAGRQQRVAAAAHDDPGLWQAGDADSLSYRDARSYAAGLRSDEHDRAGRELGDALTVGDRPLAMAIARDAANRTAAAPDGQLSPWFGVLDGYLRAHGDDGKPLGPPLLADRPDNRLTLADVVAKRASGNPQQMLDRAAQFRISAPIGLPPNDARLRELASHDPGQAARRAAARGAVQAAWDAIVPGRPQ